MFESIILGVIQGIAEWLPVSSEGLTLLIKTNFFSNGGSVQDIIGLALWLHLGTFLAALIYFRKDVFKLIKALYNFKQASKEEQNTFSFLITATLISGFLGFILLSTLTCLESFLSYTTKAMIFTIGILLLVTAYLQLKTKGKGGLKNINDLKKKDGIILGIVQGFATLPGLSRSGLTVSALLLRKFDDQIALKLSFLMSLPIVLGGNIILNLDKFSLSATSLISLSASFIFGFLTIGILIKVARKVNFGWFVLGFGILMIITSLI
ncbi:MAG: undecaprenyl-diphosphate phosphatase [Patescibacteria group bacterium]